MHRSKTSCNHCNALKAHVHDLLAELTERERNVMFLREAQRRININLRLCRVELYNDKNSTLKTLKKMEARILRLQGIITHLQDENERKEAVIEKLECAFTLQYDLPGRTAKPSGA